MAWRRRRRRVLETFWLVLGLPLISHCTSPGTRSSGTMLDAPSERASSLATLPADPPRFAPAAGLPWEVWKDLHRLPLLPQGHQALLRSSHCPTGCRYDRHSDGDWRYISVDGDEGVIFEAAGAGAITRIWMTMGFGVSEPLTPNVRIRVYVDGEDEPVVDLPLPDLFAGTTPPFLSPLVGHRLSSSGGNYSYVPIPYRDGCRVSLVGAHQERIWFQFNYHRLDAPRDLVSFTGEEDLSEWMRLLSLDGASPWPETKPWVSLTAEIAPGAQAKLLSRSGSGSVTHLLLRAAPEHFSDLELLLAFDGAQRVRMPLADFFAIGREVSHPNRSLFLGLDPEGRLYSYFPMPFFESAEVSIRHLGDAGAPAATVEYQVGGSAEAPPASSGLFGAFLGASDGTTIGIDYPLLELEGQGKWVGLFAELGSVGTRARWYLEGDERVFIDGSLHPSVYGTGVEDFFNSGFYFDQGPFSKALHGAPYVHLRIGRESVTAAYRLMPTDGITFSHGMVAGLEAGITNDISMRARTVAYYYQRLRAGLFRQDVLDLGDPASLKSHGYSVVGHNGAASDAVRRLSSRFEGEPPRSLEASGIYRSPGISSFVLRGHPAATRFRLRRRFDAGMPGQAAEIRVAGARVGRFPPVDVNTDRRWREIDVDLAPIPGSDGELAFEIVAPPATGGGDGTFTAFRYELWADVEAGH